MVVILSFLLHLCCLQIDYLLHSCPEIPQMNGPLILGRRLVAFQSLPLLLPMITVSTHLHSFHCLYTSYLCYSKHLQDEAQKSGIHSHSFEELHFYLHCFHRRLNLLVRTHHFPTFRARQGVRVNLCLLSHCLSFLQAQQCQVGYQQLVFCSKTRSQVVQDHGSCCKTAAPSCPKVSHIHSHLSLP